MAALIRRFCSRRIMLNQAADDAANDPGSEPCARGKPSSAQQVVPPHREDSQAQFIESISRTRLVTSPAAYRNRFALRKRMGPPRGKAKKAKSRPLGRLTSARKADLSCCCARNGASGAAGRGPFPWRVPSGPWRSWGPPSGNRRAGPTSRDTARASCCTACAGGASAT